jgi:uncharacterized membrane protein SpoIIM required for sporulation
VKSVEFRRGREATWAELETLVGRVESGGLASLGPEEVSRLPLLYRATLSSLSVARAVSLDRSLLDYLESLACRAYVATYGAKRHPLDALRHFLSRRFPGALGAAWRELLLSAFVLLLGAATAFVQCSRDETLFYAFVDEGYAQDRGPSSTTEELRRTLYAERSAADQLTAFSMFLFTHNARIGMLAFAAGFAAGVPTLLLLFSNGLVLGAFAALFHGRGLGLEFGAWLLPHGITELLAVVVCGAGGLVIGRALLFPGQNPRLESLARRGREAGALVMGAVFMFLLAGLVEGIFRQAVHDVVVRLLLALATAAAWAVFLVTARRRGRPA